MKVRTLHCFGKGDVQNVTWNMPEMSPNQIKIQTVMCGICRSDIGNYMGAEKMPYWDEDHPQGKIGTWGHEGLGVVVEVGENIQHVKKGDYVATWSDPAYGDFYYAKENEFVKVPELSPKYILQPVASAVNIAEKTMGMLHKLNPISIKRVLLLGSGFMSFVVARILQKNNITFTVCGNSFRNRWKEKFGIELQDLKSIKSNSYNCVIDLTSKAENFQRVVDICEQEGLICYASTPYTPVTTNFFETCWKCHTWIFPSPRNSDFNHMMRRTKEYISMGVLDTEWMWSKGYDRNNLDEVKQGFEDGTSRSPNYIRGYIKF